MNNNNIFKGNCYLCSKDKFITRVDSWAGQKGSDGNWVRGSWRNSCNDCVKEWGWKPNRKPNDCVKCEKKFIGKKRDVVCKKCLEVVNGKGK